MVLGSSPVSSEPIFSKPKSLEAPCSGLKLRVRPFHINTCMTELWGGAGTACQLPHPHIPHQALSRMRCQVAQEKAEERTSSRTRRGHCTARPLHHPPSNSFTSGITQNSQPLHILFLQYLYLAQNRTHFAKKPKTKPKQKR